MDHILEIGNYAAGFCGRLFVQAGCEVVRIEPAVADPCWVSSAASDLFLHPGKKRLQTNDQDLIAELAAQADIVIAEAATADGIQQLGFDTWESDIKLAITPFGRTGPKRNWQATPNVLLAMGGYTHIMGAPDREPLTLPGHYVEFQSGQFGYTSANACRLAKQENVIDISMLEAVMALSQFTTTLWNCAGEIRTRHGNNYWYTTPTDLFACQDGWVYINIVPTFWDPFAVFLDLPDLVIDERFATNELRMSNYGLLYPIISDAISSMTKVEVRQRATEFRIPLGVIQSFDDVLADPHLDAREFWQRVNGPDNTRVSSPSLPFRINKAPRTERTLSKPEAPHG